MGKTFIISDESVNDRGYRVLTNGIDLDRFKKNPVMLWMHIRDDGYEFNQVLPIGVWENIRKEDGKLLADAKFDENDKFAQLIKSKVDNGFIKGCSAGISPVEFSTDPKDLVKGQTRETIKRSEIYEASIVDLPANKNTVRLLSKSETTEVPLLKNNIEMGDKKDKIRLTFKSEEEMLTFMKEKFGLEPKDSVLKDENEEKKFFFKSEDDARNWFQKLFGRNKKTEEELKTNVDKNEDEKEKEIIQLKKQIENLKKSPGAEDSKIKQETDGKSKYEGSFETYASAQETWNAVNGLMD